MLPHRNECHYLTSTIMNLFSTSNFDGKLLMKIGGNALFSSKTFSISQILNYSISSIPTSGIAQTKSVSISAFLL